MNNEYESDEDEKGWWSKWLDTFGDDIDDDDDEDWPEADFEFRNDDEEEAVHKVLQHNKVRKADNTFKNRKVVMRQILVYLHQTDIPFDEIDGVVIDDWMDKLLSDEYAPRSVRQKMYALSSILQYWEKRNIVDGNPIEDNEEIQKLQKTKVSEHTDREYLKYEEYKAIFNACDLLRDEILIELLWETGVRAQEAIEITEDDIDRDNRSIKIVNAKTERYEEDDERTVYYPRSFENQLKKWYDEGGRMRYLGVGEDDDEGHLLVTKQAPRMAVGRVGEIVNERAGGHDDIEGADIQSELYTDASNRNRNRITPHLFRKSFAILRTKKGIPIAFLSDLLGHSSTDITKDHYLKYRDEDIEDAARGYRPTGPLDE